MEQDVLPKVHQNVAHQGQESSQNPNKNNWPCIQKRNPPPIPKRNPDTRLSASVLTRPGGSPSNLCRRSLEVDHRRAEGCVDTSSSSPQPARSGVRPPYANLRQYSTLPRRNHAQKLDVCAELLSYISELTQELMAETSFTEPSFLDDANAAHDLTSGWPPHHHHQNQNQNQHQQQQHGSGIRQAPLPAKSVAIQTEDLPGLDSEPEVTSTLRRDSACVVDVRRMSTSGTATDPGRSIGIQVTKWRPEKKSGGHSHRREKLSAVVPPQPEIPPSQPPPEIPAPDTPEVVPVLPSPVLVMRQEEAVIPVDSPASSVTSPTPFNVIRKMLREGSIEGIEDEPPVFKPPPPPPVMVAYVTGQPHLQPQEPETPVSPETEEWASSAAAAAPPSPPPHSTNSNVKKCLSTFEPPDIEPTFCRPSKRSGNVVKERAAPSGSRNRSKSSQKSPKIHIQPTISIMQRKATLAENMAASLNDVIVFNGGGGTNKRKIQTTSRSPSFTSKAATIDRCLLLTSPVAMADSNATKRQSMTRNQPPPPPLGKEPPPKILVEMPTKKHRSQQSSSACGTSCSCLCLKRQSPCSSPVLSLGSLPSSPPAPAAPKRHNGYSPSSKDKSPEIGSFPSDVSTVRQEAYEALIAEIRAAIKQRQASPGHDEQAL